MQHLHPLARALAEALIAVGPPALADWGTASPQAKVDGDNDLLERVARLPPPAMLQRIWTNQPCLVATRSQARLPGFADACRACDQPVAIRRSAGTTVAHHQGTLQLSLGLSRDGIGIEEAYAALVDLMVRALARLGVAALPGAAAGAFCDGSHNLLVDGRKLAGTAAFIATRAGRTASVAHAVIAIAGDPRDDIARLADFESALGQRPAYRAEAHCTLARLAAKVVL